MEETGTLPARNLIFAITGNARDGQVRSALEAGMDEVIVRSTLHYLIIETGRHSILVRSNHTSLMNSLKRFKTRLQHRVAHRVLAGWANLRHSSLIVSIDTPAIHQEFEG